MPVMCPSRTWLWRTPGATLRVLLICQHESLHNQIDGILSRYAGNCQTYWISQAELALARVETLLPHIVFVDDDLGTEPMVALIQQIVDRAPGIPIVALLDEQAMAEARQAVAFEDLLYFLQVYRW